MEQHILKYLQNDITTSEVEELKVWLDKDPKNRKVFVNLVGEWNISKTDIEDSSERVLSHILSVDRKDSAVNKQTKLWDYVIRIAAILVIGLGISLIFRDIITSDADKELAEHEIFIEKESALGQKLTFSLPDGTTVKLNSGSRLIYPKEFSEKLREVTLIGEAYFDVERDEDKPFIISSGDLNVEVLGTSFNVRSYPEDNNTEVAVKSGKVAVSSRLNENKLILDPSEMAVYKLSEKKLSKKLIENDQLIFGWVDQYLVLKDMEINEIVKVLSRWYDVKIQIDGDLNANRKFTGKYKNPSLSAIMESLSYTFNFKYEINDKRVIINR